MNLKARLGDREYDLEIRRKKGDVYMVRVGDVEHRVDLTEPESGLYSLLVGDDSHEVVVRPTGDLVNVDLAGRRYEVEIQDPLTALAAGAGLERTGTQVIRSVMAGRVLEVLVSEGDPVSQGDPLLVIEAMKMENEIRSPKDGQVQRILVEPGHVVETGAELVVVE